MSTSQTKSQQLQLGRRVAAPVVSLVEEEDFAQSGIFRCYADCEAVVLSSAGEPPRLLGRDIPEDVVEYLEFAFTTRAALSRPQAGPVEMAWVGRDCGEITVRRGEAVLPAPTLGVARVSYRTRYSRWRLPVSSLALAHVLVIAVCRETLERLGYTPDTARRPESAGETAVLEWDAETSAARLALVQASAENAAGQTRYVLTVVDYCTGDPVPGAQVLTTYGRGTADANGQVEIGPVPTGARVQLRVTAEGYQDTQLDSLNNEHFIA
ncbi:peptidase associated/transthyretin-like domain-containing protein [Megalodesulfovibrio paquesii]